MNWFKNANAGTKLILAFGLMAVLLGFIGYEGLGAASTMNRMIDELYARDMVGMAAAAEAQARLLSIERSLRQSIIEDDTATVQKQEQLIDAAFTHIDENLAQAEKTLVTDEGKASMAKIRRQVPEYRTAAEQVLRSALVQDDKQAKSALIHNTRMAEQLEQDMSSLIERKNKLGKQAFDESDVVFNSLRRTLLSIMAVAVGLAIGLGIFIARLIARPLARTVDVLEAVAARDLTRTIEISTKDEVGRMAKALNQAVEAMHGAMKEARSSSEGVATAAEQLAAASEQLSSGTQEQAASQEETSATIQELATAVKQNADNARQANTLAVGARESAESGGAVVDAAVSAMSEINASSKRIADIITTIDEIAFQTNLLALNAAVEAARAGEQGRGFAVVASEVRNLAQRSATAAKEIKGLIQDSVRRVETGSELVNKSGQTLREIVTSVKRVTDIVGEIAAACQEQASGIEQVTKAVAQMDQVTQTNSAQTEELAATSQTLAGHATEMLAMVARFRLAADSGHSVPQAIKAAPAKPASASPQSLANLSRHTAPAHAPATRAAVASKFEEF